MSWQPVEPETAMSLIGEGVHTGLRKGSEAPSAHGLWTAINASEDDAWADAVAYCIDGLRTMGYAVCVDFPEAARPELVPESPGEGYVWVHAHWRKQEGGQ